MALQNEKLIVEMEMKRRTRDAQLRRERYAEKARRRRCIPPMTMLFAGAMVSIALYMQDYSLKNTLVIMLWVLVIFYIIGRFVQLMMDRFEKSIETAIEAEIRAKEQAEDEAREAEKQRAAEEKRRQREEQKSQFDALF